MSKSKYAKMTTEDFDTILERVVNDRNAQPSDLLSIPGVYELVSEYYNNEVLDEWEGENEVADEED